MSRAINTSLATIQFQVNARQANAAMLALQEASNDLNRAIDSVNRNIANLGKDVPKDNPQLLNYQNQLKGLEKDLRDVQKAQRDFLKGAKAADQLWQAATNGNIESLSFRSIKAGINGLKKRQEGLSPGDAQDMKDWRIIKEVIDEADRVVKQAGADVQNVVQTIREGGKVSEQTMRQTINTLKELKGSVDETDADFRTWGNDLDFMEAKLQEFSDAQRRAKGEIVDANDARREMNKLTEEGRRQAEFQKQQAEWEVKFYEQKNQQLEVQRQKQQAAIDQTKQQMDSQQQMIEQKHRELEASERAHIIIQDANHAHIEGLKTRAEQERKLANQMSDDAEQQRRVADLQKQTTEQLTEKVTELQGKLAELNAEPVKPKVDTSEIDELNAKLQTAQSLLDQKTTDANNAFNRYLDARTPKRKDILEYSDEFIEKYGLQGRTFSHITAANGFRFPFDMNLSQVRDAATDPESEWEIAGPQAKKILADYEWFQEQIGKVADQIHEQYLKLAKANAEGVDIEQLKTVANNIKRLEELKAKMAQVAEMPAEDYDFYLGGEQFRSQFGDIDKTIKNTSKNIDNAIQKAIDQRIDYHDKKHAVEIQEAKEASELADREKEAAQISVDGIKAEIEAKKQNVGATKSEVETVKELIKMRERINELHQKKDSLSGFMPTAGIDKELNELMPKYEAGMKGLSEESRKLVREFTEAKRDLADIIRDEKEADEALKQFGITTADVADDLKLQAAAEKALKIEEESRLELAKQMLEVRKQIGAESLKDSRIVGSKKEQDFYKKNKDILEDEYWKGEAGGGSVGRMYKYLNDIADDSEAKAEFQEQVGVSVKDAMRVAAQRMREVLQEAMKRGIKVDDALSSFEDGYGQGPATKIYEFFKEFNEEIGNKEDELIRKRRRKLDAILDVVEDPGDEAEMPSRDERLKLAKSALKGVGEGYYGNDTPLAESRRQQEEEVTRLDAKVKEFINTQEKSNQQTEEELRLKGELETAQGKLAESKQRENEEQQEYVKLQGEAIEQGNKAAAAETKLADAQSDATQKQVEFNQKQQEGLDNINQMGQGYENLKTQLEGQEQALADTGKQMAETNQHITDSEAKKQQAQQLTIKRMEEMLAALRKENNEVIPANTEKWRENEAEINRLSGALEKLKETARIDLIKTQGAEALKFFNDKNAAGLTQADTASAAETAEKVKALQAYRDVLPKDTDAAVFERINKLIEDNAEAVKIATGEWMSFADAEKMAQQAALSAEGKGNFIATAQQMQQAQQAVQREYDKTVKSIQKLEQAQTKDQAAIDKEKAKLETLEKELKDLKFEQDNFNMSHEKMQRLIKEPVRADNLDELKAAIKRADGELHRMGQTMDKNNKQYQEFAAQVKNAKNQLKEMEGQAKATSTAWEKAWSRLKTYVGMYMGFNMAWQKVTGTADDLLELSDKMGEVRKTTNLTEEAVGELSRNLAKLDVRTPLTELMSISAAAGQLGLKTTEDIQGFTEAANKLMIALPEMGKEAATEMMRVAIATGEVDKIRKQLQEGTIEGSSATAVAMEKIASTIDRLRASSASTAPEITDFVKRLGAVGAQSGISIDQVAALGSTISSLGMRVEMSATALSRMVPAIRNNAFAIANAIGVAPETLRSLFEAGRGMEAILMIFQHLKEQNANADTIESLLGIGNMKDVMKQLNQQGARAGIVFAGLSQNVDELRKQLVIANEAYEENTAIQREFDRMNDTTAAKWERLKNRLEEMFVGDTMQKFLGGIIKLLDDLVKLISDTGPLATGAKTLVVTFTALKLGIGEGLKAMALWFWNLSTNMTKAAASLKAFGAANWLGALLTAVTYLAFRFYEWSRSINVAASEMAKLDAEIMEQTGKVNVFFRSLAKTNEELSRAKTRLEEVTKADKDTTEAEDTLKKVSAEHAATIRDINSKYGTYLGYMLSETSSAEQLARARELINAKLRETITLKQQEAALGSVEQEFGGKVNKRASSMESTVNSLFGDNYEAAARVSVAINEAAQNYAKDSKQFEKAVRKIFADNFKYIDRNGSVAKQFSDEVVQDRLTSRIVDVAEDYREAIEEYTKQEDAVNSRFQARININRKKTREATVRDLNAILADWKDLVEQYRKAEGEEKERLAVEVYKQQRSYVTAVANNAEYFDGDKRMDVYNKNIKSMQTYEAGLRKVAGEAIRTVDAMERAETKVTGTDFTSGGDSANNPWGSSHDAASIDWKNMTANQLVERRKQMKEFVNAIQTDTDVQSVLKEDAALKKAIENGMSSDMRTVIEWYNTERLKIQDELHARHLTNTGDWMDPKKQRGAHKQFRDEMDAYLHELDAYYTERKTRIEEAGTDEGLTEAEIRNRTLNNEMEWQQRRAELQKLYSRKQKEVTEEELNAIYHIIAERTGDSEKFVKAQIAKTNQFVDSIEKSGEKGAAIVHRWMSQVELDTERSYLKGQQALTKQMRAIEAIIDKERPFNGITKSLQENLATMDILTGYMRKEYNELMKQGADMTKFNERQRLEELRNTTFMLGEAENAYSTTIDRVMDDMRQNGMTAWADWLSADPKLQEALMAQLRSTYDSIQDAIKKEASQLKKQAEIMWNNILMPDGKTTLKQQTDRIVAQLGLDEGRVSRANSLIGAGAASERVADKLAIKQMQMQLAMQEHYYNLMKKQGQAHVDMLNAQAKAARERHDYEEATRKELEAQHAQMSLNLATSKEETELAKQREEIIARTEESQNRLYTSLREWADLLSSSVREVMEASHAGDADYYNELAKMNLTGKGGPGAGTYIIIDNEGTEDATAHYEYLDERQALERQHEIERENAQAEAWKKVWDEINMKFSETITDQLNAMLQNAATEANTTATDLNTTALNNLSEQLAQGINVNMTGNGGSGVNLPESEASKFGTNLTSGERTMFDSETSSQDVISPAEAFQQEIEMSNLKTQTVIDNLDKEVKATKEATKAETSSTQSSFAKMTAAANLYGVAYQAMANDNLDMTQKFEMIALQAIGNAAIAGLSVAMSQSTGMTAANMPAAASRASAEEGPIAGPILFAVLSALVGGLMGLAASKISKSKSQIAQVTGASVGAGRLSTGMLTYAEGNVNEFTDPGSLTPGRHYNVDGADGRTYRARYMGTNPRTHLTSGPEFHLSGERGREMIIDAGTTRQITMNENEIWHTIKTLSGGGRMTALSRRGRGMRAFAEGNVGDFEEAESTLGTGSASFDPEMLVGFQQSLDRNSAIMEQIAANGIEAFVSPYGPRGVVAGYDKAKKEAMRHGEKFL